VVDSTKFLKTGEVGKQSLISVSKLT